ncbi:maltose ABC transporter substrate-binding protein [Microaerobacter geothermalis]|uniref:sugar ABC transporter substrate-binding protein n=1 Tax=Microaerobacter geothermalis TaxID=674972 RepID=UPI001F1A2D17|nr:maltose ABC transporter substrate-binding protein [Microaerobacter geothermalis]MCF6094272.1 maltose ABC transporter substrate-binding protein [Microaerobacter geothermalis]
MRHKKLVVIAAVLVLLMSVLVACAKPPQQAGGNLVESETSGTGIDSATGAESELKPEDGAELIVWSNGDAESEWARYVSEEFTKKYGVPVTVEEVGHTDAPGKLQTDGPAGLGADVFLGAHDHTGNMEAAGLILENFYPDEYKERFMENVIQGVSANDTLYGYPVSIETYALYYNKDLVKQVPETWEELIEQSKAFNDLKSEDKKFGFMMEPGNFYFTYAFLGGYGGYIFGNNNTDPSDLGLNNEGALKAGEFMKRLQNEILPLKVEDVTYDVKGQFFKEGKLMFDMNGPWALKDYRDAGVNFGVIPLPKLDNGKNPTSFMGIKAYYVNAYTKYPNAATLYAKFSTSEEMLFKRYEMTGQIPATKSALNNEMIKQDEVGRAFLEQALVAVPMPNIPQMQTVWGPMGQAFNAIWNGQAEPKAALDSAVQQITDAIQTFK